MCNLFTGGSKGFCRCFVFVFVFAFVTDVVAVFSPGFIVPEAIEARVSLHDPVGHDIAVDRSDCRVEEKERTVWVRNTVF